MSKKLLGAFAVVALTLVVAASANAETYTRDLTIGATGSDVVALQDLLVSAGNLVMPAGVSKGYFGALTKSALAKWQAANGVSPAAGYFGPITKAEVLAAGSTSSDSSSTDSSTKTKLSGGNGDIQSFAKTTSDTQTTVGEGRTEQVIGAEIKADTNSDLEINSVKITAGTVGSGSTRLNRYADSFKIMLNGKEVGSADASDFTRTGATSTATIVLKDAVIKAGIKSRLYVEFKAADNIDTAELNSTVNVSIDRVRFTDASGFTTSANADSDIVANVKFENATNSSDAKVQSSSSNPNATLLKVTKNSSSEYFSVFAFKLKTGVDSGNVDITSLPIALSIYNSATTSINTEDLITDMYVEVDGKKYTDYAFTNSSIAATSTEVATSTFTIDSGDLTVKGDDTVDAVVYVKFGSQAGNYAAAGTKVTASVTGASIKAESTNGDAIALTGTVTGKEQTASVSAATVGSYAWNSSKNNNNSTGLFSFRFTVKADDEDFAFVKSSLSYATGTTATTSAPTWAVVTGSNNVSLNGSTYTVNSGQEATFEVSWNVTGPGSQALTVTTVASQEVPSDKQYSGLQSF